MKKILSVICALLLCGIVDVRATTSYSTSLCNEHQSIYEICLISSENDCQFSFNNNSRNLNGQNGGK